MNEEFPVPLEDPPGTWANVPGHDAQCDRLAKIGLHEPLLKEKWQAPFTYKQGAVLIATRKTHPYICQNDNSHPPLDVTGNGLVCNSCGYIQDWAYITEDPWGLVNLPGDQLIDKMMKMLWYATENDMIGGWCIMPVPLPPSSGYPCVGNFLGEEIATWIANMHNILLDVDTMAYGQREKPRHDN